MAQTNVIAPVVESTLCFTVPVVAPRVHALLTSDPSAPGSPFGPGAPSAPLRPSARLQGRPIGVPPEYDGSSPPRPSQPAGAAAATILRPSAPSVPFVPFVPL